MLYNVQYSSISISGKLLIDDLKINFIILSKLFVKVKYFEIMFSVPKINWFNIQKDFDWKPTTAKFRYIFVIF